MRISTLAQLPVSTYQRYVSKEYNSVRGSQCAYHPSCSAFAKEELADQGLAGLKEAFYRLRRCTNGTSSERITSFLLHAVHCPEDRVDEFFVFDDPAARAPWTKFRREVARNRAKLAGENPQEGAQGLTDALGEFFGKVHMAVHGELKPGVTPRFHLELKRAPQDVIRPDRGPIGNRLRSAASALTGVVGAALGALGAGVGGAVVGMREGFTAGAGRLPTFRKEVEQRHGPGSLSGSEPFLERLQKLSHKLDGLPGRVVETVVGGAIGGVAGLLAGGLGATAFGAKTGWDMGRTLGVNWADEKLEATFPPRGEITRDTPHHKKASQPTQVTPDKVAMFSRMMTQVPPAFQPSTPRGKLEKPWTVVGLLDGTDPALEGHELAKLTHFERQAPEGLETSLHLRRGPSRAEKVAPWLLAAATPLALAASPILGVAAGVGLWASWENTLQHQEKRQDQLARVAGPRWDGSRVFEGTTSPVGSDSKSGPMKLSELSTFLEEKLPQEPEGSVLLLSGHGRGRKGIGGYHPSTVAKALEAGDRKVELGILEGCQTATLEGLLPLHNRMNVAMASQLDMDGMGLPWHHLLGNLPQLGDGEPRDFAMATVELAGGLPTVPSLSLVDLQELPRLAQEVETLSRTLLEQDEAEAAGRAMKAAAYEQPESMIGRLSRPRRLDLAQFLGHLKKESLSEATRDSLKRVDQALGKAMLANKSSQPMGGLSIEVPAVAHRRSYAQETGLTQWASLTREAI